MTTTVVPPPLLTNELGELARRMCALLLGDDSNGSAVRVLTSLSMNGVPNAIGAGVTLINTHGDRTSAGATSEAVLEADALQYHLNQGPCLDAYRYAKPVEVSNLCLEHRWPVWTKAVRPLNIASLMSVPLIRAGRTRGAIKIYCDLPGTFDEPTTSMFNEVAQTVALLLEPADPRREYSVRGQVTPRSDARGLDFGS